MTLPMQFLGDDGSTAQIQVPVSEFHKMTGDDMQSLANPVFPIPAEREVKDAISFTIAETTQKYLDAITDVGLVSEITPYIKDKIDKIILDIGVFMFFRDAVIPETETTWHTLDQVLRKGPTTPHMIAMIVNFIGNRHLNGVFGSVLARAHSNRDQPTRWSFMLDNPQFFGGRHAIGVVVRTENLRMMTRDSRASEKWGTMWLYAMDEHIKPPEFFMKIVQHYQMYRPALVGDSDYSYKRPFIKALSDILMPWEHATTDVNFMIAQRQRGNTLGVTPVAIPEDADILSEDSSEPDDWSDNDPAEAHEREMQHRSGQRDNLPATTQDQAAQQLLTNPSNPGSGIVRGNTNTVNPAVEEEHATVLVILGTEQQRSVRQLRKSIHVKVDAGDRAVPTPERQTRSKSLGAIPDIYKFRAKVKEHLDTKKETYLTEEQIDEIEGALVDLKNAPQSRSPSRVKDERSASPSPPKKKRSPDTRKRRHNQEKPGSSKDEPEPDDRGRTIRAAKSETIAPEDDPHNRAHYRPERVVGYYAPRAKTRSKQTPRSEEESAEEQLKIPLRIQLKNQSLLAKARTRDTKTSLCQTLPAEILEVVHPRATKTKDPRRDLRIKAADEVVRVEGKDHKNLINSGPRGDTTQKDMQSNARPTEVKTPIAQQNP